MPGENVKQLLRLPWSFEGPKRVEDGDQVHWEIRIGELPGFFVAGETRDEVLNDLRDALQAFLESYLDHGEQPPTPTDTSLWQIMLVPRKKMPSPKVALLQTSPQRGASCGGKLLTTAQA